MDNKVTTLRERPELGDQIDELSRLAWPEFLLHADADNWAALFDVFAEYQLLTCSPGGELLAVGHTVPLAWNRSPEDLPETIREIIAQALQTLDGGRPPDTLSALAAMTHPEHRGRGLSYAVIQQMKARASKAGFHSLIAPVRPTLKDRFPLIPLERYRHWTRPDGQAFDPWLRVHLRLGGEILRVVDCALSVEGSVAEWEGWTGLSFPGSGEYVVRGALQPVVIDRERDYGRYEDPNVWIRHPISVERLDGS